MAEELDSALFFQGGEVDGFEPIPDSFRRVNEAGHVQYEGGWLTVGLTIPGDPQTGANLQFNRHSGHAYRPKEHKEAVYNVSQYCTKLLSDCNMPVPLYDPNVPVGLAVTLRFPYRKGDYRTGKHAGELKPNAPKWYMGRKDIDNLLKPLKDGFRGSLLADDKQICAYGQMQKVFAVSPSTSIRLYNLEPVTANGSLAA